MGEKIQIVVLSESSSALSSDRWKAHDEIDPRKLGSAEIRAIVL